VPGSFLTDEFDRLILEASNRPARSFNLYSWLLVETKMFEIIFEDADLLVMNKPANLVCHPTKNGEDSSLIGRVRMYLNISPPNSVCPHPNPLPSDGRGGVLRAHMVNRLDRETSGVVIIAKSASVAGELGKIWETRAVQKEYRALVHGHLNEEHGIINAALGKDENSSIAIKDCVRADGVPARTEYWVEHRFWMSVSELRQADQEKYSNTCAPPALPFSLLKVQPHTGRKHQIRIHLAYHGHPIVGDKLYGGDEDLYLALVQDRLTQEQRIRLVLPNHALHASQIRFHWRSVERAYKANSPDWLLKASRGQGRTGPRLCHP